MRGFPAPPTYTATHAHCPSQGKRAVRRRSPPLQACGREDRAPHRASRSRVLREADRRAQAQACRGGEAPLQAHARADAAAEALLEPGSRKTKFTRRAGLRARLAAIIWRMRW